MRALAGGAFAAPPPKPKGAPQWVYEKDFSASSSVPALLSVIIAGGSTVTPCAVTISPQAKKTTLAAVLEAAESSSSPAACVTSFTPLTGAGALTSINGLPSPAAARWKVSIDGGSEKPAKRNTSIEIGDTVYLHLGSRIAALLALAVLAAGAGTPVAVAAPAEVQVRIEGKSETLFEDPC